MRASLEKQFTAEDAESAEKKKQQNESGQETISETIRFASRLWSFSAFSSPRSPRPLR
jgi:hypothetical protein